MTCTSCGDKSEKNTSFTKSVIEIENPEQLILFRKVIIPVSMGDDETVPPTVGKYRNVLLQYEANGKIYLYSSDGIPTLMESGIPQEVLDRLDLLDQEMADETEARAAADEQLSEAITSERTAREAADAAEAATRAQAISDEASARATADATLQSNIDTVASNLAAEAATRADADTTLGVRIDGVVSDLATETSNRQSADATLQSNITAEATARANADTTLQTNINNLSAALTTETTNRTNADTALGTRIDGVAGDLATETTNRQTADTNLQTAISNEATTRANADTSLQTALSTETTARQTADTGLQSQIDAIVASSDVKDIVGTYAALQQYDTSTLGNNDIIKVLQDETHSDETTYYRWSTATSTFTLIGEEGPYYTKSATDTLLNAKADKATTYTKTEVDTALATKQDNLIAGTNISIASDGKTISATDTTYTAGTGLNLAGTQFSVDTTTIATQSDLTTGLATKQNTLTAGSNIQISNDTISATDTTYSPFIGTDGTSAGTSGLVPAPATTDAGKVLGADGSWKALSGIATSGDYDDLTDKPIIRQPGPPSNLTVGTMGQLLIDTQNGTVYQCTYASNNYYYWQQLSKINTTTDGITVTPISTLQLAGSMTFSAPFALMTADDNSDTQWSYIRSVFFSNNITGAYVGGYLYDKNEEWWSGKKEARLALYSDIPTLVQTTGASTTDVMSQNAATSMVFADPSSTRQVQIGNGALARGTRGIAIGAEAWTYNNKHYAIAIGSEAKAGGTRAVGIGENTNAAGDDAVAVGAFSASSGSGGVAIGSGANSTSGVKAQGDGSIAIGYGAKATTTSNAKGQIALGAYSEITNSAGTMNIGSTNTDYGYNSSNYRLLTGLYDPQSAHDAATKGYVDTLIAALEARIAALENA